ncbi:MAG: hypothetical protein LBB75_07820 [Oscillospiraceae bacterium]|jgi:flagellar basal body-associated protein FliL|nr:hypothetical protein [Oscillospiraceae bacterium]
MISWIANNIPLISAIAIALLSFFSSLIRFVSDQKAEEKYIEKMKAYCEIYSTLPDDSTAKSSIENIMVWTVRKILQSNKKTLNTWWIAIIIFVTLGFGVLSYFLSLWATRAHGFWSVLLWILFAVIICLAALTFIMGWSTRYDEENEDEENDSESKDEQE